MFVFVIFCVLFLAGCEDGGKPDWILVLEDDPRCRYDVCGEEIEEPENGEIRLWLDENFSGEELNYFVRSVVDFNWVARISVFSIEGFANVDEFEKTSSLFYEALMVRSEQSVKSALARTYVNGIDGYDHIFFYRKGMKIESDWVQVIKHEIVHLADGDVATNEHTDDPDDIMYWRINRDRGTLKYSENDKQIIREIVKRRF